MISRKRKKRLRCVQRYQRQRQCLKGFGIGGRKVLAKTNVPVCPLFSDSGPYRSSGLYRLLYHFRGKQTFPHLSLTSTPPQVATQKQGCEQLCSLHIFPLCNLRDGSMRTARSQEQRGWRCWLAQIWIKFNLASSK